MHVHAATTVVCDVNSRNFQKMRLTFVGICRNSGWGGGGMSCEGAVAVWTSNDAINILSILKINLPCFRKRYLLNECSTNNFSKMENQRFKNNTLSQPSALVQLKMRVFKPLYFLIKSSNLLYLINWNPVTVFKWG